MLPEYMIDFPIKIEYGAEEEKYYGDNTTNAQGDRTKKHLLAREGGSASYEVRSVQLIKLCEAIDIVQPSVPWLS